ncbi:MAG: thioredoxin family protein [Alphaproteobacteria bacterium]|nr:thioredoxin family protein [Alphaproteobacteria bacterium]
MINIRIYCNSLHREYDNVYNIVNKVMAENGLEYKIWRLTDERDMEYRSIMFQPHIVINNRVVYAKACPTEEEMWSILKDMQLIK